ncbi:MAG: hypothetical protein WKG03_00730 [Telluria sp.]
MPKNARITPSVSAATARLSSARREAADAAAFDLARRQAASTILRPNEVSGEYDAGRLLTTTLRGEVRALTQDDIRAFQSNVQQLKKKFKGGITAQHVIDLALGSDKERANKQINMAVPASIHGAKVHFLTNAGPNSDVSRHHVHVEFLDFEAAVGASPNEPKKLGKLVAGGRLKFDCDCGRHTFWYRYIATIGKYNTGRAETGYPKIRNPNLKGVACKHVLRTMHVILKDSNVHLKLAQSVLKARDVLDGGKVKAERIKVAELREMAAAQAGKRKSSSTLRSTSEKKQKAAIEKAKRDMKKAAVERANPTANLRQVERHARSLLQLGAITQAQYDQIVKAAQ